MHWPYLFATLECFGTEPKFRKWVASIYNAHSAQVWVKGVLSKSIRVERGTRQGCPLSPLLYVLYMEPFAQRLWDHPQAQGIPFGVDRHLISLYDDDVIFSLAHPQTSMPTVVTALQAFSQVSGFKINLQKLQILNLTVGPSTVADLKVHFDFDWVTGVITYLGLTLHTSLVRTAEANYASLLSRIRKDLAHRKWLPLSWLGRLATIKMNVLPRALYLFQTLPLLPPSTALTRIQTEIEHFICGPMSPRLQKTLL